jgi:hypothetical protein
MTKFIARQGDVLIVAVDEIPENAKKIGKVKKSLLVRGEGRNHGHFVTTDDEDGVMLMEAPENDKNIVNYLDVEEEANVAIEHLLIDTGVFTNEHNPIKIPANKYAIIQQQEFEPLSRSNVRVLD